MAEKSKNYHRYGVPLFGAAWVPLHGIRSRLKGGERPDDAVAADDRGYLVLAGGGGSEGRCGIPNGVLIAEFDFGSGSLSQRPVAELCTSSDLPYRIAVHLQGDGVVCASPKGCRLLEWVDPENAEDHTVP
ncbi:SEC12-like protein 2 [Syzygium oleosum]|uniref:SEC12-like protein 2 n=1 Tax=Syzygium oleosum TaxID=219896 RepID=UPI0024BA7BB2|nr:SEC12-like protein 2 [Syzygium oleosum]